MYVQDDSQNTHVNQSISNVTGSVKSYMGTMPKVLISVYKTNGRIKMNTSFILRLVSLILILTIPTLVVQARGISAKDLVIYYSFDADSLKGEDIIDESENGNDGLINGNNLEIVKDGKVNECMSFPGGATEYIAVRNLHYEEGIPALSLAVWIKTTGRGMIASWDRSDYFRFAAGDAAIEHFDFVAFDICCPIEDWHGKIKISDDNWHHVVATFDGEVKRIYVDGKIDVEEPANTNNKMIGPKAKRYGFIGIGSEAPEFNGAASPTWTFKGLMDEFLMFHRALSTDEVEDLYKNTGDPFPVEPADKLSTTWGIIKNTQ